MKVLVTGGLGFIGSHLVKRLLMDGHEVTVLDNLTRNQESGMALNHSLHAYKTYRPIIADIRDEHSASKAVRTQAGEPQDAVIHLAAIVNARMSVQKPKETMDVNLGGTTSILEASRSAGVPRFIFASSIAVYGKPQYLPYDEEHPTKPLSPYALSKLVGEQLTALYGELYGLQTVSLRFPNIYGKGASTVISLFLNRIAAGEPLTVYGGNQTDDFLHVSDAVQAYTRALDSSATGVFNVGSGWVSSIRGLISIMERELGRTFEVRYEPEAKGEIRGSTVNFAKATGVFGYRPLLGLEAGIALTCRELGLKREGV